MLFLHQRVLLKKKVMNLQYYHLMLHYMGRHYSFNNIWRQKNNKKNRKRKKRKTKKRRKEKEEINEKLQATTSYCKEQDWTFAS
jgi:hypothetical protein